MTAWTLDRARGLLTAVVASLVWLVAESVGSPAAFSDPIAYWNAMVRFGFFAIVASLLGALKAHMDMGGRLLASTQRRLLPRRLTNARGYRIAAHSVPKQAVGGDYFDVLPVGSNGILLCVADVSGHGVPAALLMSNVQAAVRALAGAGLPPAVLCQRLNDVLYPNLGAGRFVSLFVAAVDVETGQVRYASAGHPAALVLRASGAIDRLDVAGPVLGVFAAVTPEESSLRLETGDRLVVFTDGLIEAMNRKGVAYGEDRLAAAAHKLAGLSPDSIVAGLLRDVDSFVGHRPDDDVTLLVAGREQAAPDRVAAVG